MTFVFITYTLTMFTFHTVACNSVVGLDHKFIIESVGYSAALFTAGQATPGVLYQKWLLILCRKTKSVATSPSPPVDII